MKTIEMESVLFAQKMRHKREDLGLSQNDLGRILGIARSSINCIETFKQNVPFHDAVRIAHFLKIDLAEIVDEFRRSQRCKDCLNKAKELITESAMIHQDKLAESLEAIKAFEEKYS